MDANTKKFLNKAEAIAALGGSAVLAIFVSPVLGVIAGGAWGAWRVKRWISGMRNESARKRGYADYDDFRDKN